MLSVTIAQTASLAWASGIRDHATGQTHFVGEFNSVLGAANVAKETIEKLATASSDDDRQAVFDDLKKANNGKDMGEEVFGLFLTGPERTWLKDVVVDDIEGTKSIKNFGRTDAGEGGPLDDRINCMTNVKKKLSKDKAKYPLVGMMGWVNPKVASNETIQDHPLTDMIVYAGRERHHVARVVTSDKGDVAVFTNGQCWLVSDCTPVPQDTI